MRRCELGRAGARSLALRAPYPPKRVTALWHSRPSGSHSPIPLPGSDDSRLTVLRFRERPIFGITAGTVSQRSNTKRLNYKSGHGRSGKLLLACDQISIADGMRLEAAGGNEIRLRQPSSLVFNPEWLDMLADVRISKYLF